VKEKEREPEESEKKAPPNIRKRKERTHYQKRGKGKRSDSWGVDHDNDKRIKGGGFKTGKKSLPWEKPTPPDCWKRVDYSQDR